VGVVGGVCRHYSGGDAGAVRQREGEEGVGEQKEGGGPQGQNHLFTCVLTVFGWKIRKSIK
jgi:hypothetical protein